MDDGELDGVSTGHLVVSCQSWHKRRHLRFELLIFTQQVGEVCTESRRLSGSKVKVSHPPAANVPIHSRQNERLKSSVKNNT